jgi:hypothetical protein
MIIGDAVKFKDGRSKDRVFKVTSVNDNWHGQAVVDIEFQAFGNIAVIRRCPQKLLEVCNGAQA